MPRTLLALTLFVTTATVTSAHHSYTNFDMTRVVELQGVVEEVEWLSPHSLIKMKGDDERRYVFEWRAAAALLRNGVQRDDLKTGDRIVAGGNPRNDFHDSGVLNFKSVRRPSDGWRYPRN